MGRIIWTVNQCDLSIFGADILLNEDMVSALGQGCAGEYPRGLAGGNGT